MNIDQYLAKIWSKCNSLHFWPPCSVGVYHKPIYCYPHRRKEATLLSLCVCLSVGLRGCLKIIDGFLMKYLLWLVVAQEKIAQILVDSCRNFLTCLFIYYYEQPGIKRS